MGAAEAGFSLVRNRYMAFFYVESCTLDTDQRVMAKAEILRAAGATPSERVRIAELWIAVRLGEVLL